VNAQAFDDLAARYDATFTGTVLGRALRELVWSRLDDAFRSCRRLIELGCGTGEDALRLARRGTRVVAIDASPAMIEVAREKALSGGCADRIEFHCAAMEDFVVALEERSFDGVLSNFGAVNCIRDLPALVAGVARALAPGGRLLWVIMGKHVPWEWVWYLLRGRWRKAWRRLTPGGANWRGVTIFYPAPGDMARLLSPLFTVDRVSPLGFALPPSYAAAWLERSPRAVALLGRLEGRVQNCSALASLSDHYIIEATRR
jgi:ubiquinone/menaquinone biosynthesis C-methylase UbiE